MALIVSALGFIKRIRFFHILGAIIAPLVIDLNVAVESVETTQGILFKLGLMLDGWNITEGYKNGVTWVVMNIIKGFKLLISKIGDIRWITTTVVVISACWAKMLGHSLPQR